MSEKVIVKFTKPWRGYSPGEVAGFEEGAVEALVGGGVASRYSPASAAASMNTPLSEKRPKGSDRKPAGRSGASKLPVSETPTSTITPASLVLSQESPGPLGVTGDGAAGENIDGEREFEEEDQAADASAEVNTAPDDDDTDDEGKP